MLRIGDWIYITDDPYNTKLHQRYAYVVEAEEPQQMILLSAKKTYTIQECRVEVLQGAKIINHHFMAYNKNCVKQLPDKEIYAKFLLLKMKQ